jgi:quinol monooxygenase YgiN
MSARLQKISAGPIGFSYGIRWNTSRRCGHQYGRSTGGGRRARPLTSYQPMVSEPERRSTMVTTALLVRLEAKPGKEADVDQFLRGGLALVEAEPATTVWFGIRIGPSTFGIFDAFPDEAGRSAHLSGRVAAALGEKASDLFARPPTIERVEVLAAKLPT